ncbi:hypothetical protein FISHEDRAFT_63512 [Fistulina hepatica ATCC 64428]|uniref:SNF2 family DNA-dependent ATPase n=1 Tax=Fistulina hepatica ATCC 64428 TaxID=1128425 RepID=A0A0D7ANF3_9AGAR|nr:hypothetical protein FISHEDRAFT_63512 [Fistulina hepatica ATCC 64428]
MSSSVASSPPPTSVFEFEEMPESSRHSSTSSMLTDASRSSPAAPPTSHPCCQDVDERLTRLEFLIEKAAMYSQLLQEQMDNTKEEMLREKDGKKRGHVSDGGPGHKRQKTESSALKAKAEPADEEEQILPQPSLVTGGKLKNYQLEGLHWMISLYRNGISGILADEMGLGKTLQTIAYCAYIREINPSPFLVVCPLSVLHNWIAEFERFAPGIPVCMYHGTPEERREMRETQMSSWAKRDVQERPKPQPKVKGAKRGRRHAFVKRSRKATAKVEEPEDEEVNEADEEREKEEARKFPVVVTTYDIIIRDRVHLADICWGHIVVDEGHRLKNLDCRLMQEIKKYGSAHRMVLTGTPLQNNLGELWSLLNFILPDVFEDLDSFQEWFNLPDMQNVVGLERSTKIVNTLHAILKPFLLRRLKVDVTRLPPKKEYVLYAPMSVQQREAYDRIVNGTMRQYILAKNGGVSKDRAAVVLDEDAAKQPRQLRTKRGEKTKEDFDELGREYQRKQAVKQANNLRLQNTVMQLRKICSHPFLFDWPVDPRTMEPIMNQELVNQSGKMMVLERLLDELFRRKHKVLLFSQFTTMLDILEDWAREIKGWSLCRIDGSTAPLDRKEQMRQFQEGGDSPIAPCLFLLSTRAGGLGVNLTAADTVIFYDQDWNPQMDAQAQDRAHRIGQDKPVLIFRLVASHTIETKIMQRASAKRQLEALVIAKGKFKAPTSTTKSGKPQTMAEIAASLLQLDGEKIDVVERTEAGSKSVLSDADVAVLLDRSDAAFNDRQVGWTSTKPDGTNPAFAVFEAPKDRANDALAKMLGEDVE